jgi:AAA domain
MTMLPYKQAIELADQAPDTTWLVDELWSDGAVGILGGEPKCCKSFLSLELAVAVSSGQPCLGHFPVHRPGTVLLFAAEDAPRIVKTRLMGIAEVRGVQLSNLDIQVITSERLRLDDPKDVEALDKTVAALRPRLLILDPFVRLHRIDENSSHEVAVVLEHLRLMQRRHGTSILIVHHAKKNGGATRAGQALRGSSEFHAWGDSNLYMRRTADMLSLTIEHRAAASRSGIPLALKGETGRLALEIEDKVHGLSTPNGKPTTTERIERALVEGHEPMTLSSLRQASGLRTATLCETLKALLDSGRVHKTTTGYALVDN